jgi:site-specific DNA-methyltransferase (adenine-specific)
MWERFKRVIKPRGAIVLTASQPFTSALVMSNVAMFRYEWVWDKALPGNFLLAQSQPMKIHENTLVFGIETPNYYPEMRKGIRRTKGGGISNLWSMSLTSTINDSYYPRSIIEFPNTDRINISHPTQKPVALFRYLIRTYTQPDDVVLDPCVGSGTTALAAREEQRHWICGDSSAEYVEVARKRMDAPYTLPLFKEG